ncbi:helix-turn-helix domain-containing protein [Escherichia coli]|uniref:helix-turn-helix domain-containing protein n=1 Tax=Escherichia coli TaxID=562 RepID=UPI0019AFEAB4|nr:helix-turn-helix transcriptional regulator [Escherichia coli]MDZ3308465.1 helix-turn-helix domain-containing protein [Klebsiella pneumoniae]MCW7051708.1 helix-turn-helix domain-containing protein [Escherichia coli]HAM8860121.1 XRE family transcriptional regulator [Escherichia coli]HBD2897012.1 XRE family transcriptional regulator [Escherichia coli]HBD2909549.1 XRE family transcriptional regulator [Escherichia coli]
MALKFYDSPFHVTHDDETASKMAMKMDLSIMIINLIKEKGWTQKEAAEKLGINQSRVSELKNAKIELFTVDAMFDMLDALGFRAKMSMTSLHQASIAITETEAAA